MEEILRAKSSPETQEYNLCITILYVFGTARGISLMHAVIQSQHLGSLVACFFPSFTAGYSLQQDILYTSLEN